MREYWLSLYPETFLWIQGEEGYVYNTVNYQGRCFDNVGFVVEKTMILKDMDSLYRVRLNQNELDRKEVQKFVDCILEVDGGCLVQDDGTNKCPVSMKPKLRVQDDVGYYQWLHRQNMGGDIVHNLHKLVFYLNGSENGSPDYCKQIPFPHNTADVLDINKMISFIETGKSSNMFTEVCFIGNLWVYKDYLQLLNWTRDTELAVTFYFIDVDFLQYLEKMEDWNHEKYCFRVLVVQSFLNRDLLLCCKKYENVFCSFVVASDTEYEYAVECIEENNLQNSEILPVYRGDNLSFFEEGLFVTKEDIKQMELSKREIFIHQILNVYDFGKLYVMSDGNVYTNLNNKKIGEIEESVYKLIYREMTEGESWFKIRNMAPCNQCLYQWLCPSPSNYELATGIPNFCHR